MRPISALRVVLVLGLVVLASLSSMGCGKEAPADIPDPAELAGETVEVSVFFSTGRTLTEEYRVVDANDIYVETFAELLAAKPQKNVEIAIVQPEARILGITVVDGTMTIDWGAEVLDFEAADREKVLALASVLMTAGQFPEVKKVQFTVEGKTEGSVADKDIHAFWGRIGLAGQPWDAMRPPVKPAEGTETTATATSSTEGTQGTAETSTTTAE